MPVLDTSLLIGTRKRPDEMQAVLRRLASEDEAMLVPMQTAMEYAAGTADPAVSLRSLSESFVLRPFDADVALEAARLARAAFRRGVFPGWGDVQVAATASHEGMYVVTGNVRHFRDALGVRAWDYVNEPEPPEW